MALCKVARASPRRVCRYVAALWAVLVLQGCSSGMRAIGDTLVYAVSPQKRVDAAALNPKFEYLRLESNGHVAMLALGYREADGTEVYYSGAAETLHIRNGRVIRFTSHFRSFEVHYASVVDSTLWMFDNRSQSIVYDRHIDEQPHHRFSQPQRVTFSRAIAAPEKTNLRGIDPKTLNWFQERIRPGDGDGFPSVYAVNARGPIPMVVYSEQCMTAQFCITLQRWSASGPF